MVKQAGKRGRPPAREKPGKMDIRTVAQLANVSIATVSRTINRVSTVNPEELAILMISLLEGAFVSSKLQRSQSALLLAQQHLETYLESQVRMRGAEPRG